MRKTTELEMDVMIFLNALRESGVTNMYGATPYIIDEFGIKEPEAMRILVLWMENFNVEGHYEEVNE